MSAYLDRLFTIYDGPVLAGQPEGTEFSYIYDEPRGTMTVQYRSDDVVTTDTLELYALARELCPSSLASFIGRFLNRVGKNHAALYAHGGPGWRL